MQDPDRTAIVAETLEFNGIGSSHPDGSIISYEWDFGDRTLGSGEIVTRTYAALGSFTVILIVIDSDGATATDTAVVTVLTVS
jgi:PKD repeat protein